MAPEHQEPQRRPPLIGRFTAGLIAASVLWAAATFFLIHRTGVFVRTPAPTVTAQPTLSALIAKGIAALGVKPKTVTLPSDLALEVNVAIKRGDYDTAGRLAASVLARSHLTGWRFYPFDDFMSTVVGAGNDPTLLQNLDRWQQVDPTSVFPYLIRAQYYETTGWAARGTDRVAEVPAHEMERFRKDLDLASGDLRKSITIDSRIPWSYLLLLKVNSGDGDSLATQTAFEKAVAAFPGYYPLYRQRLYTLTPKWGGSVPAMYGFVERYAGGAPEASPLKLLYPQLYAYLADAASTECSSLNGNRWQKCVEWAMSHTVSPQLPLDIGIALRLYKTSDHFEFGEALWTILGQVASLPDSNSWSGLGVVLQAAAKVMGSDEQMSAIAAHNSYVLDDITARVWEQIGNNAIAEQKFRAALRDAQNTSFSDPTQKDEAVSRILDDMTTFADDNSQYINMIIYRKAADEVGGVNHGGTPFAPCYAYYHLRHFRKAVRSCTRLIESDNNYLESHYWRAKAYEGLHQWDAALADFRPIAEGSNNWFRVGAALDMSYIYGQKHDYAGELASLNGYAYLFNPALQAPSDLAVAFNNRCYAYMQLGRLHKALSDCTTSLRYGHIPDAVDKELELIKRLRIKELPQVPAHSPEVAGTNPKTAT